MRKRPEIDPEALAEMKLNEERLARIIKPLGTAKWQADYDWSRIERSLTSIGDDYGGLDMNPDFQRGHVWTPAQQVHFIENCLRGVVTSAGYLIQLNCPQWAETGANQSDLPEGLQCIDGLQRYTAITEFVKGNVKPFGLTSDELMKTRFSPKRLYIKVAMHDFTQRSDLLEYYLSINAGGTPHSEVELMRVQDLLDQSKNRNSVKSEKR